MEINTNGISNSDEAILLRRINDMIRQSEKHYTAVYSHFLDPAQQAVISSCPDFSGKISFDGGYDDAERRLCRAACEEYCSDSGTPVFVFMAEATDRHAELSHRDVLGALMGLGIKREMIGDILTDGRRAWFFCHNSAADYISLSLTTISRYSIKLSVSVPDEIPKPGLVSRKINISSMRLDCIVAEGFGMSRSKSAESVKKGLVSVNWLVCTDPSREIHTGDRISLRGSGKLEVGNISGTSKKGRLFLEIHVPE